MLSLLFFAQTRSGRRSRTLHRFRAMGFIGSAGPRKFGGMVQLTDVSQISGIMATLTGIEPVPPP